MPLSTWIRTVCLLLAIVGPGGLAHAQYPVGTADVTYTDGARGNRAVPVDLYYPATAAGAGQPVAEAPAGGGFATVAFGHGFQMPAGAYAWVAGRLAEFGCVVAVPRTGGELFPSHAQFGLDLAFAARTLRDAGALPASPFFGRMGPRALVMGHSMGGGCALLAAAGDPTLTAVAAFAAAETNPSAVVAAATIDRPALLFAGTNDCVTPPAGHQIPMYGALAGWRALATIDGASHCQFNAYNFLCDLGESCSAGITRQEQQDTVWRLLEPWVRWVLLQEAGAGAWYQSVAAAHDGFSYEQVGAVAAAGGAAPRTGWRLHAAPNPFNPAVVVTLELDAAGPAELAIFDARGRRVRVLADGPLEAGSHAWRWDGRDEAGRAVPGGCYLARVQGAGGGATGKLVLLR
ncbi:MAG: dienelactone hydrolase family protein [bacterium]|nr:dienelactone hydrolase family protein [bacterium]